MTDPRARGRELRNKGAGDVSEIPWLELEVKVGKHVSKPLVVFLLDFRGRGHRELELRGLHELVEKQSADSVDRSVNGKAEFEVVKVLSAGVEADFTEGACVLELVR